jgi:hypothetical protein
MKKWLLLLLLSALIGAFLVYFYDPTTLEPFRTSLLTITFAITTFSATFSMGAFNSSAYRQFHHTFPPRLLWSCVALLFVAFIPLAILVCWSAAYIPACLVLLPILAVIGPYLQEIGRRETDPITLLDSLCSLKLLERYLHAVIPKIDAKIDETEILQLSKPGDKPTHEFDWHLPLPPEKDNPIDSLTTLGLLAIRHGDLHVFSRVVKRSLEAMEMVKNLKPPKTRAGDYKIRAELRESVYGALHRMILELQQDKSTVSLSRVAIDALTEFVVAKSKNQQQTQNNIFSSLFLIELLAKHCFDSGSKSEIRVLIIVARQIVQKGIDDPPQGPDGLKEPIEITEFHWRLPDLTNCIKRVGSFAIEKGDMELLYRCFDAFAWLGCSAVKSQHIEVVTACLQALSQLGREVRVKELECFDNSCPVRPEAHAIERIDWIVSWVAQMTDDQREHWIGLVECAYSRFYGREVSLSFTKQSDNKGSFTAHLSNEKHIESYSMRAGSRDVDYSDFHFLKDHELRSGKGTLMQGPIVPLFS